MRLFRKPVPLPSVTVAGIPVRFDPRSKDWSFDYQGTEFLCYDAHLTMPDVDTLDNMLASVERLGPEMKTRLKAGWADFDNVRLDDGETWHINLDAFSRGLFEVCWSGGASWGDMGIAFAVEADKIVGESWAD